MSKFLKKLRSKRGETFAEILIAILIVAFGCMIIAVLYDSSLDLNIKASEQDGAFYSALSETEQLLDGESSGTGHVIIEDEEGSLSVEVGTYGDGSAAAYKRQG